jgi:hypothetical protein
MNIEELTRQLERTVEATEELREAGVEVGNE